MSKQLSSTEKFLQRHSFIIFVVAVAISLATAIMLCYQTYTVATTPGEVEVQDAAPTNFDPAIERRIQELHTREQPNIEINIPQDQRINPFVE